MTFNIYLKSKNFKFNPNNHENNALSSRASVKFKKIQIEMFDQMLENYKKTVGINIIPLGNFNKNNQYLLKFKHISLSKKNVFISENYLDQFKDFSICFETLKKEINSYGGKLLKIKNDMWVASCIKEVELKQALITMEMINNNILQSRNFSFYLNFNNGSKEFKINKKNRFLFISDNTILVEFFKFLCSNSFGLDNFDLKNIVSKYKNVIIYFNNYSNDQKKNLYIIQSIFKSKINFKLYVFTQNDIKIISFNNLLNFFSKQKHFYF
jgi:hypothetical protein